ncbi:hypothetical protein [Streptomyces sp. S1]|uniref:hypothetical protein n=1 Tax=unclassified Streptomyces TaxID=2593676 RepID=UPI0013CE7B10|nr:hypothetical protein [Streptomyces sp. S1]
MIAESSELVGSDWIGESRRAYCEERSQSHHERHLQALESGNRGKAAEHQALSRLWLRETLTWPGGEPKRVVSDQEAGRLRAEEKERQEIEECAARLAEVRKRLEPRAHGGAYKPFSGGLPTLGRRR